MVHKRYTAFTNGAPTSNEIRMALRDDGRRVHVDPRGKPSHTSVRVERMLADGVALVQAVPITGRRHQIRVHLASVGAPLLVDPLYGSPGPAFDPRDGTVLCDRLTLHASQVRFPSPDGDFEEEVAAPLPPDLLALHRALSPSS
jgi:23S rRNA-/tRNA-specific pseudouridylate synthase